MFINSKKCFEVREAGRKFSISCGFIGTIPDWVANHWLIQAAIRDGSIATPENTADKALEAADEAAGKKAEEYDVRPKESADEAADKSADETAGKPRKGAAGKGKQEA